MNTKENISSFLLAILSVFLFFLIVEVASRAFSDEVDIFSFENFVFNGLKIRHDGYQAIHHSNLGNIPRPGFTGKNETWGTRATNLEHGVRSNGATVRSENPILVVGDSFTYGSDVSDDETWPAYLEKDLKRPVINGGVPGYGFDQIVLRAEDLERVTKARTILVSFIAEDIVRTQFSEIVGTAKPYFVAEREKLIRKNSPVPNVRPDIEKIGFLRNTLGYSYFMKVFVDLAGRSKWWIAGYWQSKQVHNQGRLVSCLLTKRLADLQARTGARVILIAQYRGWPTPDKRKTAHLLSRSILDCAASNGLETLDLFEPLEKAYMADLSIFYSNRTLHMSPKGNRFIADQIARHLNGR